MYLIKLQRVLSYKATFLDLDSQVFNHNIVSSFVTYLKAKITPKTFSEIFVSRAPSTVTIDIR